MMTRRVIPVVAAVAALQFYFAPPAEAQTAVPEQLPAVVETAPLSGAVADSVPPAAGTPARDAAQLGVRPGSLATTESVTPAAAVRGTTDNNTLLMIVGGVLFLAGIAMDDDAGTVVALSGLGVGLYGLIRSMD